MMIVALVSDIHGNLPALKAVLQDANLFNAKQIWFLGDLIGYIPFPNECVELVRKKASASIVGNYDQKVIRFKQKKSKWKNSKKPAKYDAFEWNYKNLNFVSLKYLRGLSNEIRRKIGKFKILLTHGSPQNINEPVLPETPKQRLVELGKTANAEIILMGHTHLFMNLKTGNQWFINPGSVGLPVKNDFRASYALLEILQDEIKVTERKVQYDVSKVVESLPQAHLSGTLIQMIKHEYGIDLKNNPKRSKIAGKTSIADHKDVLKAVRQFARECDDEKQHSEQVTLLALKLFDELTPLHKLKNNDRFLLNCAALLHDIGWIEGQKGHHKTAMRLIFESQKLPFTDKQRRMVALIARYHRKALPKDTHPVYSKLSDGDKRKTRILAGILRIADGLDRTHNCVIQNVECESNGNDILVKYQPSYQATSEIEAAYKKSDLIKQVLNKNIQFIVI